MWAKYSRSTFPASQAAIVASWEEDQVRSSAFAVCQFCSDTFRVKSQEPAAVMRSWRTGVWVASCRAHGIMSGVNWGEMVPSV